MKTLSIFFSLCCFWFNAYAGKSKYNTDVLIVGGGTSGVMAGIQAARMGVKTIIVEESVWIGGMLTSAGVSAIDGNHNLPSGLWNEFRAKLEKHYGSKQALASGWVSQVMYEPSVGEKILREMCAKEKNLSVISSVKLLSIQKKSAHWQLTFSDDILITAKILIDATELGDVAAKVGVKYDVGMDAQATYQERIAPEKANHIVQDLTYVAILKDYHKDITISKPSSYNKDEFICACEKLCPDKQMKRLWDCQQMKTYGQLQNDKYMINWPINGNDFYVNMVEMNDVQREEAIQKAKDHTLNFVYFMQKELGWNTLGLADEFPTADKLPLIPYHRESRRIHGLATANMNHLEKPFEQSEPLYRTGIAVGDYPIDQHHGKNKDAPDLYFVPVPSFNIPLGSLIPDNVEDLIVAEKSISVSNLVSGASRLQPVVMGIGQAAGTLAAIAIQEKRHPKEVSIRKVQDNLLKAKAYLMPYLDVKPDHPNFEAIQRIGATGILKGEGKNYKWSNQTWFYPDSVMTNGAVIASLKSFFPNLNMQANEQVLLEKLVADDAFEILTKIQPVPADYLANIMKDYPDKNQPITRAKLADLIDKLIDPFHRKEVDFKGNFIEF
ncbi:FAD-dependent oxidoreductase [Arcicella aquatica]|uniref:FAD-dependent oxidoreductase n=1 Tax=Arcicella aquatica TaxID=217141 RepID=A0ABU5QS21_9BACT|nr:FAD-dependent oxidoreductase [Arcicella aquatica]MEA5259882.1 FAD-dependent oxidoreductase [Arcicella aquatica]